MFSGGRTIWFQEGCRGYPFFVIYRSLPSPCLANLSFEHLVQPGANDNAFAKTDNNCRLWIGVIFKDEHKGGPSGLKQDAVLEVTLACTPSVEGLYKGE